VAFRGYLRLLRRGLRIGLAPWHAGFGRSVAYALAHGVIDS